MLVKVGLLPDDVGDKQLYYGHGCHRWNNMGFVVLTEVFYGLALIIFV